MKEYIYILTNESMPGLVKIGRTTKSPEERSREISNATGVPHPFVVAYAMEVTNGSAAEKEIHGFLSQYRVSNQREFFRIEVDRAEAAAKFVALKYQGSGNLSSAASPNLPQEVVDLAEQGKFKKAVVRLAVLEDIRLPEAKTIMEDKYGKQTITIGGDTIMIIAAIIVFLLFLCIATQS